MNITCKAIPTHNLAEYSQPNFKSENKCNGKKESNER